jgi:hypothetical protein
LAEAKYAPKSDPVFLLVPTEFANAADQCYLSLGSPPVNRETIWEVYNQLVNAMMNGPAGPDGASATERTDPGPIFSQTQLQIWADLPTEDEIPPTIEAENELESGV